MNLVISVVICTHNPKQHYLRRVLDALRKQTLPPEQWELLVIDNASVCPLESTLDLSWHTHNRCIREERLGLTYARLRGIREAKASILVFVDDDNILAPDYLEIALRLSQDYPQLGAWGGQSIAEFESLPPEWTKPYWVFLGIREFEQDLISYSNQAPIHVIGAGGCYRKPVANAYSELVTNDPLRSNLDRKGSSLLSRGDIDMCYAAYDLNLGTAVFTTLKLIHLMPPNRFKEEYLIRLVALDKYSELLLLYIRGNIHKLNIWKHLLRVALRPFSWLAEPKAWMMSDRDRRFRFAERKASLEAMIKIYELQQESRSNSV